MLDLCCVNATVGVDVMSVTLASESSCVCQLLSTLVFDVCFVVGSDLCLVGSDLCLATRAACGVCVGGLAAHSHQRSGHACCIV